jgi:hypothetical protein
MNITNINTKTNIDTKSIISDIEDVFEMFYEMTNDKEFIDEFQIYFECHEDYNHVMYQLLSADSINDLHDHFKYMLNKVVNDLMEIGMITIDDWDLESRLYYTLEEALTQLA